MKFGAHISTAKPFSDSIIRAQELGCECMQIFANPPQRWNPVEIPASEVERFITLKSESGIGPVIIHSIYLINFASNNPFFYEQSIKSLVDDMQKAKALGALGANTHLGSTKGGEFKESLPKITDSIKKILDQTEGADFIIENSAGAGNIIGDTIEEIGMIVQKVDSPRVKVLIDTAHAFASGYDLGKDDGIEKFIGEFEKNIGLDRLVGFHLNDSKSALDSHRDRHADIGEGHLGIKPFEKIVNHPKLRDLFGILETPQDTKTWKEQLAMLREIEK